MSEQDKARRYIKITEYVFLYGGLFLGVMGAIFTFLLSRGDLGKQNMLTGVVLVGIGNLAGCIRKIYERLDKIEGKLGNQNQEINDTK